MGRNKKSLTYETRTPAFQELACNSKPPLRLHTWFDYKRNLTVVEVCAEPAPPERPLNDRPGNKNRAA